MRVHDTNADNVVRQASYNMVQPQASAGATHMPSSAKSGYDHRDHADGSRTV
jgi:hypothetical protein